MVLGALIACLIIVGQPVVSVPAGHAAVVSADVQCQSGNNVAWCGSLLIVHTR